ncbi:glycosyltransferase family 4 protein [Rhodohalobacter sulfatireducens]|uniref:Glycosyltransferase family 4 protein n=1 Tax=Rhodohalobacter sulfatireducens TaxID=2911366 RepID=A0ABS9KJL5_9BACT|nr:glycosyltransferase family 4 protein [Rhodohalobacter sulfatireducens]MCG2591050.1 glycosyltransferase family 4 protein [Rhodohalobacter sulfatireducens]
MKHVVHVSNDFYPLSSGINTHLQNLLPELTKQGFKVTLLVPTASNDKKREDIFVDSSREHFTCVRVKYPAGTNLISKLYSLTKSTRSGLQWIKEQIGEIEIIHQHDNRATRIGATYYARDKDIPVIWTNHSSGFFRSEDLSARMITYIPGIRPDAVIVVHRMLLEPNRSFFNDSEVRYIPNGVNLKHFQPGKRFSKKELVILFPQRMIPQKGVEVLAKAAKVLLQHQDGLEFKFLFAGSGDASNRDSGVIKRVKELLNEDVEKENVQFLGNPTYKEMPAFYSEADIVVLPLQVETENISVFEAWATGTPLITTKQVEKNGYMVHNENCLVVPDQDPEKLSEAIIRLAGDLQLRQTLSANGRELVQNQFRWFHAAEKTADFYREVLTTKNI